MYMHEGGRTTQLPKTDQWVRESINPDIWAL